MKNSDKYIGVFDSGVGGLTLVKALLYEMPNENIVYFGDTKHMPYGDKTNEQIISYVLDDIKFLNNYDLKAMVIACNTADSVASNIIKQNVDIPVYGVLDAAAKSAASKTKNNKVGVIATTAAVKTDQYKKHIQKYNPNCEVYSKACPLLVPLIEDGKFDIGNQEIRYVIKDYLASLIEQNIDTLVLGCTHYDLIAPIIQDMYPNIEIVSSSKCVVKQIVDNIERNNNSTSKRLYYCSSDSQRFKQVSSMFIPNIEVIEK